MVLNHNFQEAVWKSVEIFWAITMMRDSLTLMWLRSEISDVLQCNIAAQFLNVLPGVYIYGELT